MADSDTSLPHAEDRTVSGENGCASGLLMAILAALVVSATGLPSIDAIGLSWNTSASAERQRTEQMRIEQQHITERLRIEQQAETARSVVVALAALCGVAVAGASAVLVARARASTPSYPPHDVRIVLAELPGWRAEIVDGEWCVATDHEYMPIGDAAKMLEMR